MRVGIVGIGVMGSAMLGHLVAKGHEALAYDVDPNARSAAAAQGARAVEAIADLATAAELAIVVVATDEQSRAVVRDWADHAPPGSLAAIAATNHPRLMQELSDLCSARDLRLIDAPVVYGASGARDGTLVSLCGGSAEDVDVARPALMAYSRAVLHVGPVGAGQVAKACNNLLHWVHCVANYETLLLAKRLGLDAQRLREVLLECPGANGTLRRWDTTRFTWQEKDMDVTMDLAQGAGLVLPLAGQVDQLIKTLKADDVEALLYGSEATYLGVRVTPLPAHEGGLGGASSTGDDDDVR